ncbi:MAG: AAA family ATPase [Myxococcota bacterium]
MDSTLATLKRLITFLPYNLVEEVVVDGAVLQPRIQWVEGCLLSAELNVVPARTRARGAAADEEVAAAGAELARALQRILEDAVFPRGGYLLKFSGAGVLVMFTARTPGVGPQSWSASHETAPPARRAARCGVELLSTLKSTLAGSFTLRAGVEKGRFRLALCGRAGDHLEQLALGSLCRTVAQLRDAAGPGELVAGPELLADLDGCGAHIGPLRGAGRRVVHVPPEAASPRARVADLEPLLAQDAPRHLAALRVLMPPAVAERVGDGDGRLGENAEVRPVTMAALPLETDHPDTADDNAVLLDLTAGVDAVRQSVAAHNGVLLRLDVLAGGSAAIAAFGLKDPPRRAARQAMACALDLSGRLAGRQSSWRIRAGIEAGRAYLGELGSPLKREVAVVGGPAVVALELARQADDSQVLVGQAAWRLAGPGLHGRPMGQLQVGQPPRTWEVFQARGMEHAALRIPVGSSSEDTARAESARAALEDELTRILDVAASGKGSVVVVHGPLGMGKSRVLTELAGRATALGFSGATVRCWPDVELLPQSPGSSLLAQALPRSRRGAASWREPGMEAVKTAGDLGDGASGARGMMSLLRNVAQRGKHSQLLLGIHDVQHADPATLSLLESLVAAAPGLPVMLVLTASDDDTTATSTWRKALAAPHVRWLAAPPLAPAESRAILTELVPSAPDDAVTEIVARAHGNAGALREVGELVRSRLRAGMDRVRAWSGISDVANSVEMSQLRLDALPPHLRDLARLCSVLGPELEALLLFRVLQSGDTPLTLGEMLARVGGLVEAGVLSPALIHQVAGYRFPSATMRQVAYLSWPQDTRARWHDVVAQALQAGGGDLVGNPVRIAAHLRRGRHPTNAVEPLRSAARTLERGGDAAAAELALTTAVSLLTDEQVDQRRTLGLALADLARRRGAWAEADRHAGGVADDIAAPPQLRAHAWHIRGAARLESLDAAAAFLAAQAGRHVLPRKTHATWRARLYAVHAQCLLEDPDWDEARLVCERAQAVLDSVVDTPETEARLARGELTRAHALALVGLGRTAEAVRELEESVLALEKAGLSLESAQTLMTLGQCLLPSRAQRAVSCFESALPVLEANAEHRAAALCALGLAQALTRAGDVPGAVLALDAVPRGAPWWTADLAALATAVEAELTAARAGENTRALIDRAARELTTLRSYRKAAACTVLARACDLLRDAEGAVRWQEEARAALEKRTSEEQSTDVEVPLVRPP